MYNDESKHMWEVVLDMDCGSVASEDGFFRFTAHMVDSNTGADVYEKAVEQGVCDGGVDLGTPFHESLVHYGL